MENQSEQNNDQIDQGTTVSGVNKIYIKDFDTWNNLKKEIDSQTPKNILFHTREVWWCTFGLNIGSEQNGVGIEFDRPVLIIKKLSPTTFLCAPLTTKKKLEKFQSVITTDKVGYVLLDQVRTCDSKRLIRKIATVNEQEFSEMVIKFNNLYSGI